MSEWVRVADVSDIPDDEPIQVKAGGELIALTRYDGRVYAVSDVCTHEYTHLSDGFMDGPCIECPLHGAMFDVRTGEVKALPATRDLPTYPVKVDGDDVYVQIEEPKP